MLLLTTEEPDEDECRQALYTGFMHEGPVTVRYPRGAGAGVTPVKAMRRQAWGKGEVRRKGQRVAILAFGTLLYPALAAADRLDATVANMRFVKPLDADLVAELARTHDAIVTVEDGCIMGGAGSAVSEARSKTTEMSPRSAAVNLKKSPHKMPIRPCSHSVNLPTFRRVGCSLFSRKKARTATGLSSTPITLWPCPASQSRSRLLPQSGTKTRSSAVNRKFGQNLTRCKLTAG
jgi:hypothetical protein